MCVNRIFINLSQSHPVPCSLASAQRRAGKEDCPPSAPVRPLALQCAASPRPGGGAGGNGDGVPVSAGQLRPGGAAGLAQPDAAEQRGRCGRRAPCGGTAEPGSVRVYRGLGSGLVRSSLCLFSSPPPWSPAVPRSCKPKEAMARRKC